MYFTCPSPDHPKSIPIRRVHEGINNFIQLDVSLILIMNDYGNFKEFIATHRLPGERIDVQAARW